MFPDDLFGGLPAFPPAQSKTSNARSDLHGSADIGQPLAAPAGKALPRRRSKSSAPTAATGAKFVREQDIDGSLQFSMPFELTPEKNR
jgi:hypothetical protein